MRQPSGSVTLSSKGWRRSPPKQVSRLTPSSNACSEPLLTPTSSFPMASRCFACRLMLLCSRQRTSIDGRPDREPDEIARQHDLPYFDQPCPRMG
jgi:hypothetical protein